MRPRDFSGDLREMLSDGVSLDSALETLRARGASIVESIVSVRSLRSCELVEAKRLVHASPAWSDVMAQNENLYEELERGDDEAD